VCVCVSVLFVLSRLQGLTEIIYLRYAGTFSEYLGQVRISRSSGKVKVKGGKRIIYNAYLRAVLLQLKGNLVIEILSLCR